MKRKFAVKTSLFVFFTLLTGLAQAHSGHDHSHWSAGLIHSLLALSVVAVAASAFFWLKRSKRSQQNSK